MSNNTSKSSTKADTKAGPKSGMTEDTAPEASLYDWGVIRRIVAYAAPYKKHVILGLIGLLALSFSANLIPIFVQKGIDEYIAREGLEAADRIAGLIRMCGIVGGLALFLFLFRAVHHYLLAWIGQNIVNDLRTEVFEKILSLHLRYFDQTPVGRLMTRITSDLDALQRFVTMGLIGLVANLFLLVGVMGFMLWLNWKIALMLFVLLPILGAYLTVINLFIRRGHRVIRNRQSALNAHLQENVSGMFTVQMFNQEENSLETFDERNQLLRHGYHRVVFWNTWYFPGLEFMNAMAIVLILAGGGIAVLNGHIEVGIVIAFFMYTRDFFRPLEELSDKAHLLQTAMASAERVFNLLDTEVIVADPDEPTPIEQFRGDVRFDHVTFAYDGENNVLNDVSFHVPPGQSLALVGATGAGKTSVISLIARFYDVQQGSVKIDGHDVRDYAQSDLRRRVGIVLQDPFIFSGTVADNITMNNPTVSREDMVRSAQYVNAHPFILRLPDGYDTELGERGASLSTGQKQLLALARALVQDPDILLILDEATANVDTETERLIQEALSKLMQNRTTILIAHRLSTIKDVDRILVLRQGRLIESGSHSELLSREGYYKTLYEMLSHMV